MVRNLRRPDFVTITKAVGEVTSDRRPRGIVCRSLGEMYRKGRRREYEYKDIPPRRLSSSGAL